MDLTRHFCTNLLDLQQSLVDVLDHMTAAKDRTPTEQDAFDQDQYEILHTKVEDATIYTNRALATGGLVAAALAARAEVGPLNQNQRRWVIGQAIDSRKDANEATWAVRDAMLYVYRMCRVLDLDLGADWEILKTILRSLEDFESKLTTHQVLLNELQEAQNNNLTGTLRGPR